MSIVILNLLVFFALVILIAKQMRVGLGLSKQILLGLTLGVIFGLGLQLFYVGNNEVIKDTLTWTNVVGSILSLIHI